MQMNVQAVVTPQAAKDPNQGAMQLALFKVDGAAVDLDAAVGSKVVLTGFATGTAGAVADTDTVNQAIAKLQARIVALESA